MRVSIAESKSRIVRDLRPTTKKSANQGRSQNPDQGAQKNSTWRRPFNRGARPSTASSARALRLRLVVFWEAIRTLARRSNCLHGRCRGRVILSTKLQSGTGIGSRNELSSYRGDSAPARNRRRKSRGADARQMIASHLEGTVCRFSILIRSHRSKQVDEEYAARENDPHGFGGGRSTARIGSSPCIPGGVSHATPLLACSADACSRNGCGFRGSCSGDVPGRDADDRRARRCPAMG